MTQKSASTYFHCGPSNHLIRFFCFFRPGQFPAISHSKIACATTSRHIRNS